MRPGRNIRLELSHHALGVERGDEHGAGARIGEFGYRRGPISEDAFTDASRLLDVGAGDFDFVEAEEFVKGVDGAVGGIVHGDRRITPQGRDNGIA